MKITIAFLLISLSCVFTLPVDKKDEPAAPVPKVPETVPKSEPKVPETEPKPVPKEPQPVPKKPETVPKEPQPVPKKPETVPKEPQPVPKKPETVPKAPQPIPKQPETVPKQPQTVPQAPKPAPKPVPKLDCLIQLLKKDAPALLEKLGTLLCNFNVAQKEQNMAYFMSFLEEVDTILQQVGCTLSNLLGFNVVITAADAESIANQVYVILFQFLEDIIARVMKILEEIPILGDFINDVPLTQDIRHLACSVLEMYLNKIAKILTIVADVTGGLTQIIQGL
ncbi:uncharacterized protein [Hyperolius riggenbachi]|uniref:uncharacterized protein n=1 Tax=Hyperolius riggenbachi TaxID=752182 RepID=UPI0035A383F8